MMFTMVFKKNCLPAVQYSNVNKISNVVDDYEVFSY